MKIKFITLVALLFLATEVAAQDSGKITFDGNQVQIEGSQLLPVAGEEKVWEIELEDNPVTYALVSKNNSYVEYIANKQAFKYEKDGLFKMTEKIPCLSSDGNKTGSFFLTAKLVLSKELMPITINVNNEVIAEFRQKVESINYQKYSPLEKTVYLVGEKIELTPDSDQGDMPIKSIDVFILKSRNTSIKLQDGTVDENCLGGKDSIICDIKIQILYKDNTAKEEVYNHITLKKEPRTIRDWCIVGSPIVIFLIVIFIVIRKLFKKSHNTKEGGTERNNSSIFRKLMFWHNENEQRQRNNELQTDTPTPQDPNNLFSELVIERETNTQVRGDVGSEEVIKTQSRIINELEAKIRTLESAGHSGSDSSSLFELRNRIAELEASEREKIDENKSLLNEVNSLKEQNKELLEKMTNISADSASKKDLRNKIEELKGDKNKLIREKLGKEREITEAKKTITSLENTIKEKDDKITETKKLKDEAESNLRIEKNTSAALQTKINSFSRQTYYLYSIDDTLQAVDNSLKSLFANVHDDNLMKRLAQPVLSGTAGLDAGLESYLSEWKDTVYNHQNLFFGTDVLSMSDESVNEKLTEFLEQLALRDSFGKLVRLYLMTNVGWINDKMVAAGFDVDAIQTLFVRFKNLFQLFNIDILYPHLFVDKFDSNLHKDNMRCEIFNYFEPSEELLKQLKNRDNENLIVDVTRIGIPNSKNPTRRNAMVSLPNF